MHTTNGLDLSFKQGTFIVLDAEQKPIVLLLVRKKYTLRVITLNFCEITKKIFILYICKKGGGLSCTCFVINHDEFDELCSVCLVSKTKHKLLMVVAKYGKP